MMCFKVWVVFIFGSSPTSTSVLISSRHSIYNFELNWFESNNFSSKVPTGPFGITLSSGRAPEKQYLVEETSLPQSPKSALSLFHMCRPLEFEIECSRSSSVAKKTAFYYIISRFANMPTDPQSQKSITKIHSM